MHACFAALSSPCLQLSVACHALYWVSEAAIPFTNNQSPVHAFSRSFQRGRDCDIEFERQWRNCLYLCSSHTMYGGSPIKSSGLAGRMLLTVCTRKFSDINSSSHGVVDFEQVLFPQLGHRMQAAGFFSLSLVFLAIVALRGLAI